MKNKKVEKLIQGINMSNTRNFKKINLIKSHTYLDGLKKGMEYMNAIGGQFGNFSYDSYIHYREEFQKLINKEERQ